MKQLVYKIWIRILNNLPNNMNWAKYDRDIANFITREVQIRSKAPLTIDITSKVIFNNFSS